MLDEIREKQQQDQELGRSQVDAMLQAGASPSAGLIGKSGYESEYIQALENYYKQQAAQAAAKTSGRSGGTTRRSGGTSGGNTTDGNESGLDLSGPFRGSEKERQSQELARAEGKLSEVRLHLVERAVFRL